MIIHKTTKSYVTRSDKPNENWTNDSNYYVVDDRSPLAKKIIANYPYFDLVVQNGLLVDVTLTDKPTLPPPTTELSETEKQRQEIDEIKRQQALMQLALDDLLLGGGM